MKRKVNSFVKQLKEQGLTVAFAESMTCGMATHKLASCTGTSDVLKGSVICYTPEVKKSLLGISQAMIDKYTCESKEVTDALADKLSGLVKSDIHAAITGLASEGGSETKEKPVGTVFFCVRYKGRKHHLRKLFRGTPLAIREKACLELYRFILEVISK
jgi:nicotinamide-nucleotide amidase